MRLASYVVMAVTTTAVVLLPLTIKAQEAGSAPVMVSTSSLLDSIRKAPTASEAIGAYGKAVANTSDPTFAEQAFIGRMIELNSPELAEAQAKDVTQHVQDGQAWGVLAFASGKAGQFEVALDQISHAVQLSSDNAFVQRTAAQLLAWYDTQVDKASVSDSSKKLAEGIRSSLQSRKTFASSYDEFHNVLTAGAEQSPVQAGQVIVVPSAPDYGAYGGYGQTDMAGAPPLASYWAQPFFYSGYYYPFNGVASVRHGFNPSFRSGFFRGRVGRLGGGLAPSIGRPPTLPFGGTPRIGGGFNGGFGGGFNGRPGVSRFR